MAKLGWVDAPFLKQYRKWAFLGAFLFAAILTPTPDPFNRCLMALPMYFFYEVGIISASFFKKPKTEEEAASQEVTETSQGSAGALRPKPATASTAGGDDDYGGVPQAQLKECI